MKVFRTLAVALLTLLAWSAIANSQESAATATWENLKNKPTFAVDTSLLLTDGTVMVHQYSSSNWWRLTPDSTGSYINGTWSELASMPSDYGPLYFASAVLADGNVIVQGGEYNFGSGVETPLGAYYNSSTNTWTAVTAPTGWRDVGDASGVVLAPKRAGPCCPPGTCWWWTRGALPSPNSTIPAPEPGRSPATLPATS